MDTVEVGVLLVLAVHVVGFRALQPTTNPHQLHSLLTPRQHMADSSECWPNTTSKVSLYHQGKSTGTFHLSRMLWD